MHADESTRVEIGQRWKHKKRGTFYVVTKIGTLQCSDSEFDDKPVVIYTGDNGNVYARPYAEFIDGRFERQP
jgi:hypothetical protein